MEDLARIIAPFNVEIVLAALRGEPTVFDLDGIFRGSRMGPPSQVEGPPTFDGRALVAGAQTIAWLAATRPVGDALRAKAHAFDAKVRARLANASLLLMGGFASDSAGYVYFCPARLKPEEHEKLARLVVPAWKSELFPFSSVYGAYRTFMSDAFRRLVDRLVTTPLVDGKWEADPRASAPDLVRVAMDRHKLSEDAATVYLQLLALADCTDDDLMRVNGWARKQLDAAGRELVDRSLVVAERKLRAGRSITLPGAWEKLRAPQPGIERDKLPLFEASFVGDIFTAPLGRVLALAPLHEIFATAWSSATSLPEGGKRARPAPKSGSDRASEDELLAEIVRAPEDDAARLVYADLLLERGDRRGEMITLACKLARSDEIDEAGKYRLNELLADPEVSGTAFIEQRAAKILWVRGFVSGVHMKIPDFIKSAPRMFKEHPLLRRFVIEMGLRRITDKQIDDLAACESLARIAELDFSDHYVAARAFARFLQSPNLGRLHTLSIGANTKGGGIGKTGSAAIAGNAALAELRVLELPGQRMGDAGAQILAGAASLAKLEVLRVPANDLTDVGGLALLDAPALKSLRILDLHDGQDGYGFGPRPNRFSSELRARLDADARVARPVTQVRGLPG